MAAIPDAARDLLDGAPLAHAVTINPDGSPQVSCVWVERDGDELVIASLGEWQKVRNLRRDRRIVLSFEGSGANPVGMQDYLVIHGVARIEPGGAPEALQRMAERYVGPGVTFPPMPNPPPGHLIRVRVDRVGGSGPWISA